MSLVVQVRCEKRKLHFTRAVYANYIRPPGSFDPNACPELCTRCLKVTIQNMFAVL